MREWIANKLFDLARWVDWDAVHYRCECAVMASDLVKRLKADLLEPEAEKDDGWKTHAWVSPEPEPEPEPKRRSSVAAARKMAGPKRPRGRPKGSKNKPRV